jgi:hypothetical protein
MDRRRRKWVVWGAIALGMILWFGTDVYAQGGGGGACAEDIAKFCQDVQPGGGRLVRCLKEHADEISAECRERLPQPRKNR